MLLDTIEIIAVSSVSRPPRRHNVCNPVRFRSYDSQESLGGHGSGSHFMIIGLLKDASMPVPIPMERKDNLLKVHRSHSEAPRNKSIKRSDDLILFSKFISKRPSDNRSKSLMAALDISRPEKFSGDILIIA